MATPLPPAGPATPAPAPPQVVRAGKGETLKALATRHFKDDRAADLLAQLNPGLPRTGPIPDGAVIQLPARAVAASWAAKLGITLGVDPNRPSGTRQKRAWNAFQSGPTNRPAGPSAPAGPDAALVGALGVAGVDRLGPGILTAALLKDPAALSEAVAQRVHWIGAGRVLEAAAATPLKALEERAARAAHAGGVAAAAGSVTSALQRALWDVVVQEIQRDSRTLLARAQQALQATANHPHGGHLLLASLADAHPDTATRLLLVLGIPRAEGEATLQRLAPLAAVRAAAGHAAGLAGPQRQKPLLDAGLPAAAAARLAGQLGATAAQGVDVPVLEALGVDAVARRAHQGAQAMLALVQRAAPQLSAVPASVTAAHCHVARQTALARLGVTVAEHPTDQWATNVPQHALDATVVTAGPAALAGAAALPDTVRVAWRAVEALGARLLDVDAHSLGQGLGVLAARVAPRATPEDHAQDVRRMRSGAVAALGSKAAVRAQTGVEAQRALVPHAVTLAVSDALSFAATAAPSNARTELRRRLVDTIRSHYAVAPGTPRPKLDAAALREDLETLVEGALVTAGRDDQDRLRRVQAALKQPALVAALSAALDRTHGKFRREELTLGAMILLSGAWLMEHARGLPQPGAAAVAVVALCQEEGGRILDAMERDLLRRLG